jgi:phosphonate degradation associated HDIG domain protein
MNWEALPKDITGTHASPPAARAISDEIVALFSRRGSACYGEHVSMTEHSLQAAQFAQAAGAPTALVIAALLHDVGHLVAGVSTDLGDWSHDARHEDTGSRWLSARFAPEISEPVRLHVPAKRYLCATDPDYARTLSPASVATLKLQGGPMSAAEARQFERERYFRDAVAVRRWDDQGKVAGLTTPGFEHYRGWIDALAAPPCI